VLLNGENRVFSDFESEIGAFKVDVLKNKSFQPHSNCFNLFDEVELVRQFSKVLNEIVYS